MKSSTLLESAVFQLTPTRTRCELVISANGKTEKIASGLVNPFLAHLKTAQEQMAKGGYSIILEPEHGTDATWFTRDTVEKFVRFVSTPDVLERVYTTESEILQIEEAIAIQSNNDMGLSTVEDHHAKPVENIKGSKAILDTNDEKAIVLYKPGEHPPKANGSAVQEGNSKVQLLRVLETRKAALQKEQGMAFACAVAAGFDVDHMAPLISFAECFGASRLMDACIRFMELWKRKHETGQWLEIETSEAISRQSEFSAMNASGIILSNVANKQNELGEAWSDELASKNEDKTRRETGSDGKPPTDHQAPPGYPEYVQGQFPNHMFPPWPMHSLPGAPPFFQAYPMQGMPYYQNYPGNNPYFQPPYPTAEDPRINVGQKMGQRRHSMNSRDISAESETLGLDASKARSQDDLELDNEVLQSQKRLMKANRSAKMQSGRIVIRNINYITSKKQNSSGSESQSASDSGTDEEDGDLLASTPEMKHRNSLRSSKRKESKTKSIPALNSSDKEEATYGNEADGGYWQAFQNCLLRDADEDRHAADQGMFAMGEKVKARRQLNTVGDDPLVFGGLDMGLIQGNTMDMQKISGNMTRLPKASNDPFFISGREGHSYDGRIDGQLDAQSAEIGRRGGYRRTTNDDFLIHRRENQSGFASSDSDTLAVNGFEYGHNNLDRSSNNMDDDSYIVPHRSVSLDQVGTDGRNAIFMDSEFPSTLQKAENSANRIGGSQVNREPDDLSLMPERGAEKGSIGYDPALDYEVQVRSRDGALNKRNKEVVTDIKQGSKKSDKDRKSKLIPDTLGKKKTGGPIRKGKPSKLSPLDEARARAEKLRSFKADLQKVKKEKEKEEIKRLEGLKIERQKRIAARGSSVPARSPLSSQQTRKQSLTKLSPGSHKGSKFSDMEPGSSAPLQRFPVKTSSVGSNDSQKASKPSRLNAGNHSAAKRLSWSVSSMPEPKKGNNGVTPDIKASMARIRRLSEPKTSSSDHVSSVRSRSTEQVSKSKISNEPERKKISAIMNLDKSKAATLPELKIRLSRGPDVSQSKLAAKEKTQKVNASKSSTNSEGAKLKGDNDEISYHDDGDDKHVIEKAVAMLECEKSSIPAVHASEKYRGICNRHHHDIAEKSEVVSDYAAIHAPVSPLTTDGIDREHTEQQLKEHTSSNEVRMGNAEKEVLKFSSISSAEKPYQPPYARVSSLEDPCTRNSEYGKAPPTNLEIMTAGAETVKAQLSDSKNPKLEKIPEALEKPRLKESSRGLLRLLKFGRKNHSSDAGEHNNDSDNVSVNGSEPDDNATNATSSEVYALKNLISQDETPTAVTTQKSSRPFSLLSPFRSKSGDKKITTT